MMIARILEPFWEGYRDSFRLVAQLFLALVAVVTAFASPVPVDVSDDPGQQNRDAQ